jgi:hypothetical protein
MSLGDLPTGEQVTEVLDNGDWVVLECENLPLEDASCAKEELARLHPECTVFWSSPRCSDGTSTITIKPVTPQDAIDCRMGEIWEAVELYQHSRSIDPYLFTQFVRENGLRVVGNLIEDDFHDAKRILREYFKLYPKTGKDNEQT